MSGGVALEAVEIPLEANGQTAWFIDDAFTTTDTSDFAGAVRCTAPGAGRFTAIAAEMDAAARHIFTTVPVVEVNRGRAEAATLDFAHFANGTWITDLVFVNLETRQSGPPLTPFHTAIPPTRPAIYFLRHRGQPDCPRIGGGRDGRSDGHRGRRSDGPDGHGAAERAHDFDPRARGVRKRIGEGGLGGSPRRDAPL